MGILLDEKSRNNDTLMAALYNRTKLMYSYLN